MIAAELQTCKTSDVPRSRDEVREYFAEVRPRLCTSERANRAMHYLLRTPRAQGKTKFATFSRLVAPATIATLPGWMRTMGGSISQRCWTEQLRPRCERQSVG